MTPFTDKNVEAVFANYPPEMTPSLLALRQLIIDTSEELLPNEPLIENLKWNQPTYTGKKGTPIRIGLIDPDSFGLFFHCQTSLIEQFREQLSDTLTFSKNRAIVLSPSDDLPLNDLKLCIQQGLTYHKKK